MSKINYFNVTRKSSLTFLFFLYFGETIGSRQARNSAKIGKKIHTPGSRSWYKFIIIPDFHTMASHFFWLILLPVLRISKGDEDCENKLQPKGQCRRLMVSEIHLKERLNSKTSESKKEATIWSTYYFWQLNHASLKFQEWQT